MADYKEKAIKTLGGRDFPDWIYKDCENFLEKKENYIKNPCVDTSIEMKRFYEYIYYDIKHEWVGHSLTDAEFWEIVDKLKEVI